MLLHGVFVLYTCRDFMRDKTSQIRKIVIIVLALLGIVFIVLSIIADAIRLDSTPDFGVVQMVAFLAGLTFLTLAAYLFVYSLRPKGTPRSLQADIGVRLGLTGLVFVYITGFSDLLGIGTHVDPSFDRPFVGPLQLGGLLLGTLVIIAGLLLFFTSRGTTRETSSMEFLVNGSQSTREAAEEQVDDHHSS